MAHADPHSLINTAPPGSPAVFVNSQLLNWESSSQLRTFEVAFAHGDDSDGSLFANQVSLRYLHSH